MKSLDNLKKSGKFINQVYTEKKMKKISILLTSFLIIIHASCGGKKGDVPAMPERAEGNPIAVVITPNTAMRIDPLIFSSRVALLKKGEVAEVLERSIEEKNIGNSRSYWYKVKLASGITGWIYGANLTILDDSNRGNVESYLSQFWEKETEELSSALHGKWWSVNRFNDFTSHCLEIYKDGKYKSYIKGASKKLEGEYNFDFNNSKIIFLGETSFSGSLSYIKRGDIYTLFNDSEKDEIKFKMINTNPESEDDVMKEDKQDESEPKKQENEG